MGVLLLICPEIFMRYIRVTLFFLMSSFQFLHFLDEGNILRSLSRPLVSLIVI